MFFPPEDFSCSFIWDIFLCLFILFDFLCLYEWGKIVLCPCLEKATLCRSDLCADYMCWVVLTYPLQLYTEGASHRAGDVCWWGTWVIGVPMGQLRGSVGKAFLVGRLCYGIFNSLSRICIPLMSVCVLSAALLASFCPSPSYSSWFCILDGVR